MSHHKIGTRKEWLAGWVKLLLPQDTSGLLVGEGVVDGVPAVAFASDPRVQGGALGSEGCAAVVAAYDRALDEGLQGIDTERAARYRQAANAFKRLNRRMLARGRNADDVARTIERALTDRRPRPRYWCGGAQRLSALMKRAAPVQVTDRIPRRLLNL